MLCSLLLLSAGYGLVSNIDVTLLVIHIKYIVVFYLCMLQGDFYLQSNSFVLVFHDVINTIVK